MEWERAAKKTRMGFSREQPPSRKPLLAHNPPPQKNYLLLEFWKRRRLSKVVTQKLPLR